MLMRLGNGLGIVQRDRAEECLTLDKITILVGNPINDGVGTC